MSGVRGVGFVQRKKEGELQTKGTSRSEVRIEWSDAESCTEEQYSAAGDRGEHGEIEMSTPLPQPQDAAQRQERELAEAPRVIPALARRESTLTMIGRRQSTMQFWIDAPTHFRTVAELVNKIGEFLPQSDVLRAASVSTKWRGALLWDGYYDGTGSISGAEVKVREFAGDTNHSKSDLAAMAAAAAAERKLLAEYHVWARPYNVVLLIYFLIQLLLLIIWTASVDRHEVEAGFRWSLMIASLVFYGINIWAQFWGRWFLREKFWKDLQKCGASRSRLWVLWLGSCLCTGSILGMFVAVGFASDLDYIVHDAGSRAPENPSLPSSASEYFNYSSVVYQTGANTVVGLTDRYPWATVVPTKPCVTDYSKCRDKGDDCCVYRFNPEGHSCADGYQVVETQHRCTKFTGDAENHREYSCVPPGCAPTTNLIQINDPSGWQRLPVARTLHVTQHDSHDVHTVTTQTLFQNKGPFLPDVSPSCEPAGDGYPNRTVFLDVSPNTFDIDLYSRKVFLGIPNIPPGVENLQLILMNRDPQPLSDDYPWDLTMPFPAIPAGYNGADDGADASLVSPWKSLILYNIDLPAATELNLRAHCARAGIQISTMSPEQLNVTLQQEHELSAAFVDEEVFFYDPPKPPPPPPQGGAWSSSAREWNSQGGSEESSASSTSHGSSSNGESSTSDSNTRSDRSDSSQGGKHESSASEEWNSQGGSEASSDTGSGGGGSVPKKTAGQLSAQDKSASQKLRFWLAVVAAGDPAQDATTFSQSPSTRSGNLGGQKLNYQKIADQSWTWRYDDAAKAQGQRWTVWLLPIRPSCQFPTLAQNTGGRDQLLVPSDQAAGSFMYTGDRSFYFAGRSRAPIVLPEYSPVPVIGGIPMPDWLNTPSQATGLLACMVILFFFPVAIFCLLLWEFDRHMQHLQEKERVLGEFHELVKKWWEDRAEAVRVEPAEEW